MERKKCMSLDRREKPLVTSAKDELFENIFIRYYPLVYRLAYRYVGQPDEAEDIAQEVFLRFYHLPSRATNETQQRAWLCRVAINLGLNALRKRKSHSSQERFL
jgi:RNA polymerase sigma-70 factor (ECF subfamily)